MIGLPAARTSSKILGKEKFQGKGKPTKIFPLFINRHYTGLHHEGKNNPNLESMCECCMEGHPPFLVTTSFSFYVFPFSSLPPCSPTNHLLSLSLLSLSIIIQTSELTQIIIILNKNLIYKKKKTPFLPNITTNKQTRLKFKDRTGCLFQSFCL